MNSLFLGGIHGMGDFSFFFFVSLFLELVLVKQGILLLVSL
jgi:hypothetical protein